MLKMKLVILFRPWWQIFRLISSVPGPAPTLSTKLKQILAFSSILPHFPAALSQEKSFRPDLRIKFASRMVVLHRGGAGAGAG